MTRSDAYVFKKKVDQNLFFFLKTMNCIFGSKKKIVKQFILSFKTKKKKRFQLCSSLYKKSFFIEKLFTIECVSKQFLLRRNKITFWRFVNNT